MPTGWIGLIISDSKAALAIMVMPIRLTAACRSAQAVSRHAGKAVAAAATA